MRFSLRSKMSIVLALVSVLTIASAFMLNGVFKTPTVHASGSQYISRKGTLTPAGTVNLSTFSSAPATRSTIKHIAKPIRAIHPSRQASQQLSATASPFEALPTGAILHNFNGVSSLDSAITNFGAEFEPPDQGLCVGNGFVLEQVNSALRIYNRSGSTLIGPLNVNDLYAEGPAEFTSDPRCYYDKTTNRWFSIILFISSGGIGTVGRTDIAVSDTGDPTKTWTVYHLDGTDFGANGEPNNPGCPCFGDQPLLGIDQANLYVSTNEFSILGPQFNGAQVYALSKSQLVSLATTNFVHFENLTIGGAQATSIQPAITNGNANAEYFMNSLDPTGLGDTRLGVWAITNRNAVTRGGIPNLSSVIITSEAYQIPPNAIQKGSSSTLNSGDDRMQQVQYINGKLWGALGTGLVPQGDTATRAGIAWFEVQPQLHGSVIGNATMTNQGYVASAGNYLIYPAIQVSIEGTGVIGMTLSGPNYYPSSAFVVMHEGQHGFGGVRIAANGTGPYDPNATRWGDYSAAVVDPNDNSFWLANEYIPPVSSQTLDRARNWGTRVVDVNAKA